VHEENKEFSFGGMNVYSYFETFCLLAGSYLLAKAFVLFSVVPNEDATDIVIKFFWLPLKVPITETKLLSMKLGVLALTIILVTLTLHAIFSILSKNRQH
jgi:hypothetical protein